MRVLRLKLAAPACICDPTGDGAGASKSRRCAGQGTSIHSCLVGESKAAGVARDHRERLSKAAMVDLLGMFRRRPAKRAGFARSRDDITALGSSFGNMLASPVRDAPPIAREAPVPRIDQPRAEQPPPAEKPRPRPKPDNKAKTNGAAGAPRMA